MSNLMFCMVVILGQSDPTGDGCTDLRDFAQVQNAFTGPNCTPVNMEMVLVPGGGAGPDYDFLIGKYEVTNEQFAAFLNDAEFTEDVSDPRRRFLSFRPDGSVKVFAFGSQRECFKPRHLSESPIAFQPDKPAGSRYVPLPGMEHHPATHITWFCAAKFCNWFTIFDGLDATEQCYSEDSTTGGFVLITDGVVVPDCRGYRIPITTEPGTQFNGEANRFNEWYKATAYSPAAPGYPRLASDGAIVDPFHWRYGHGEDTLKPVEANFGIISTKPHGFPSLTTTVDFYDGSNWLASPFSQTVDTLNYFGLYGATGNVAEWVNRFNDNQSYSRAIRGCSFYDSSSDCDLTKRREIDPQSLRSDIGFRVLRVP